MASSPDLTKGLIRPYDLLKHLIDDVYKAFEILEADKESQYLRRSVVRTVFSFIEGVIHIIKFEIKSEIRLHRVEIELTLKDGEVLYEEKKRNGETFKIFIATDDNLKKTFKIAKKVWMLKCFYFNSDGDEYEHFKAAKKARDRLTHPRTFYDVKITDYDMSYMASSFQWILAEFKSLMNARVDKLSEALPEDVRKKIKKNNFDITFCCTGEQKVASGEQCVGQNNKEAEMPEISHRTDDIFGISRDLPMNYQERETADNILVDSLARHRHIVIYGSSKQGKTCLRKHCLNPDDYITVHCSNKWQIEDLHAAILKKCGYEITLSNSRSRSGKQKIFASLTAGLLGAKASGGAGAERESRQSTDTAPLELEPEDVNDIISALGKINFTKFIILEDFHYLPIETQKDFAVALKAFHENSRLCFIVIGVWLEENRLAVYNGDLTGRVLSIDADSWKDNELRKVIETGEKLLNISFGESFKSALLVSCFNSVHIVQEACHRCCTQSGVHVTLDEHCVIGENINARSLVKDVVNQQTGRFNSFITQFADGFQATELEMHRWLLYPVLTQRDTESLSKGLRQKELREVLREKHPRGATLNQGNVTQALQSAAALQIKKDIKPMVLDYDQTNLRLNVVDRSFLIWIDNQDRNELLAVASLDLNDAQPS